MAKKLATYVHVRDKGGQNHVFGPDDDLPAWAEKAITNPKAWADEPDKKAPAKKAAQASKPQSDDK